MHLYLARHCLTDWNLAGRVQGQTDTSLNERGRLQAQTLAETVIHQKIDRIVCSDLLRAHETAMIVQPKLGVPLVPDARLRECGFGKLEGLTKDEILARFGVALQSNLADYDFTPWGGEHRDDVLRRHLSLVDELRTTSAPVRPLLIGHGRGLATLISHLGSSERIMQGEMIVMEI